MRNIYNSEAGEEELIASPKIFRKSSRTQEGTVINDWCSVTGYYFTIFSQSWVVRAPKSEK